MSKNKKMNADERFWQLLALADEGDENAQPTSGRSTASPMGSMRIQAVFTGADAAKSRALAILEGKADPSSDLSLSYRLIRAGSCPPSSDDGRLEKVETYHKAYLRRSDILALVQGRAGSPSRPRSSGPPSDRCPPSSDTQGVSRG